MAAGGKESATVDNETRLLEDVRWKIQCLCRSKQPTTLVVGDLVTRLGLSEGISGNGLFKHVYGTKNGVKKRWGRVIFCIGRGCSMR